MLPPETTVYVNNAALHLKPEFWGADSHAWRPDRWIKEEDGAEVWVQPVEGSYMPWGHGARLCPGKKFAQVEFVAVVASLMKEHRVRPVVRDGETEEDALKHTLRVIEESDMDLAVKMLHPERLRVRWERKSHT